MSTENLGFDDDFMAAMLGDFLDESQEYLSRLNENLLTLDELVDDHGDADVDTDILNEMFRAAHSLKGLSAMLQLDDINRLTHRIENIFDAARSGRLAMSRATIDLVFDGLDKLTHMVERLKDPQLPEVEYESVVDGIRELLEGAGQRPVCPDKPPAPPAAVSRTETNDGAEPLPLGAPAQDMDDPLRDVVDDDDIPEKYISLFISETDESLDALSDLLVADSIEDVTPLMVICHRIKGAAASIGLRRCAAQAHAMEDLLQSIRDEGTTLTPALVDALLLGVDAIRGFVDQLKSNEVGEDRFGEACAVLRAARAAGAAPSPSPSSRPASPSQKPVRLEAEDRRVISEQRPSGRAGFAGVLAFDPKLPLVGMKARLACDRLASLGQLFAVDPPEDRLEQLDHLDRIRFGLATDRPKDEVALALDLDGIVQIVLEEFPAEDGGKDRGAPVEGAKAAARQPAKSSERRGSDRPAETVRVDIDRLDQLMNLTGQLVISKARFSQLCDQLKDLATRKQSLHLLASLESRLGAVCNDLQAAGRPEMESLRTHVASMQRDFEAIRGDIEQLTRSRPIVNDLAEAVHQLGRVTDGIQKSVMETRMVPIGPLFSRFKRVIRDITRSNGKDIRLIIRGEKTELDKRMIDELSDPLIHMVRNAADHGIESPDERAAAGKPVRGTVTLDAFHRGNQIHIQVRDDGRGLDPDKLRDKAVAKGILTAADAQRLSDAQALKLIWEPGFSTAEQITEVSGRGMGMDIVRSKIERINGSVELESEPGAGTTISINLPLTMAILPSLLTVIRHDVFAIPVESVIEIVRVSQRDLATVRGVNTARVRGRIIPIIELEHLFRWHGAVDASSPRKDEWTLVVVGTGRDEIGLAVEDVLGEEDIVIKSLAENYRNVEGLAGASILGNGRVSLILDVPTLIELASEGRGGSNLSKSPDAPERSRMPVSATP